MPIVPNAFQHIPKKIAHVQNTYVHYLEETNKTQSRRQLSFLSIRHLICHFCLQHFSLRITTHGTAPWFSKFRYILTLEPAPPPPLSLFTFLCNGISIVGFQTSEERLRNELKFSDGKKYLQARFCTYCTKRNTQSHTQTQRMLVHKSVKSKTKK
jgi:hypothetical protein